MTRKSSMSNAQRAAVALRELIFSGELAAGSDHLETELAQRLGMSRTPVREASLPRQANSFHRGRLAQEPLAVVGPTGTGEHVG